MSPHFPTPLVVDALVGATAYLHPHQQAGDTPFPADAVVHLQKARVDIYCSHNNEAMWEIKEARRALSNSPTASLASVLVALDQAAWLTRHNEFLRAEEALETALDHIRGLSGVA
ncbi:MAG: hypothetical protein ACT6SF_05165 [Hydrogenophaga sp.]|jgi:hypothetical protein|uniref:hypothetical protein n=1 Tax=Hydrogenophaga sp. TaxID=1904254 RepID=UPI001D5B4B3E|nr:hypothetical protein [Hydrogenophaga sp.]MBW0168649.1 hypothetical protein [Hydrogenophaga sp.]MBW0182796.1 hypothetical protein [Hydrogenophaga sp.]